jgi:hypothetical protein
MLLADAADPIVESQLDGLTGGCQYVGGLTHCRLDCLVYRADLNCLRALGRSDFLESRSEVTELAVRATQRPHGEMRQARLLGFLYQATGVIQTVQHDTQPDFAEIFIRRTSRSAPMPVVVDDDDPARAHARPQVR